jgi:hypothetical protein
MCHVGQEGEGLNRMRAGWCFGLTTMKSPVFGAVFISRHFICWTQSSVSVAGIILSNAVTNLTVLVASPGASGAGPCLHIFTVPLALLTFTPGPTVQLTVANILAGLQDKHAHFAPLHTVAGTISVSHCTSPIFFLAFWITLPVITSSLPPHTLGLQLCRQLVSPCCISG